MASIIGIDLGSWAVKATVLQGGFNRYDVDAQYIKKLELDGDEPPSMVDRLTTLETLLSEMYAEEPVQYGATFPIDQASMRLVKMPFSDKNQIAQTLAFEVEALVPYDLEDMVLTHRITSTHAEGSSVLASLTPVEGLGHHLAALNESGADPKSFVLDGDLLGVYGKDTPTAIIDIGHMRTIVTVAQSQKSLFSRGISFGGWHLTKALADEANVAFADAEKRKHAAHVSTQTTAEWGAEEPTNVGTAPPVRAPQDDGTTLRASLAPLIASIRTTLIGYEDESGTEIENVLITGGTANLNGLISMLTTELGVPVQKIQSGGEGTHSLSLVTAERAAGINASSAMELRAGQFKFRGDLANMKMVTMVGAAAVVLLGLIGLGTFVYSHQATKAEMADLDRQIAEVVASAYPDDDAPTEFESPDDALLAIQLRKVETKQRIELLGSIVSGTPPTITTLNQLSNALPDPSSARIDVSELTINENSINMKAETDGYDAAATIESSLQANTKFKQARKGDEKKNRNGIQFSVTISLKDESEGEES